ncbi:MAG: hypothetical protein IKS55_02710 [Oscillospiraceae bacterium]|nr:hypothetical protein [Oscillospiraceae bacterium]
MEQYDRGDVKTVWSCGGGVQSTAIAAAIETGVLPKPDFGIMVDCGFERAETMEYVRGVIAERMKRCGVHFEIIPSSKYVDVDIVTEDGHVNIPAFRLKEDGSISKLSTHCNGTWKVKVSRTWMHEHGIESVDNWIGISTDEARRMSTSPKKWISYKYPLIDLGWNRDRCIFEIQKAGWPKPRRTSCCFCPQQDEEAWLHLFKDCPEDWKRAVAVDEILAKKAPDVFLLRSCVRLKEMEPIFNR